MVNSNSLHSFHYKVLQRLLIMMDAVSTAKIMTHRMATNEMIGKYVGGSIHKRHSEHAPGGAEEYHEYCQSE